jgi:hypothetical protein
MKKILILASNPRKDLNLDHEIRELKDVIERSRYRDTFEVEDALAVRVGDLQELLLQHQPQIVHFCGHGGGQLGLVLEDNLGNEQLLQTDALRDLFRLFSSEVQCVLLNACYSDEQADEIVQHIDYVIGMDQEIRDDAAIAFSKGFYRALGYGCEIEKAYGLGCNAIQLELNQRATARSRSTGLPRKAEVLQVLKQTVIPEHMKPILKKRTGKLLATASNARPSTLPAAEQAELQRQIADAVTKPPDASPTPSNLSIPQRPIDPPQQRRVAPWLVGSICLGLLPTVGFLAYRAWTAKPPALPDVTPPIVVPVTKEATKEMTKEAVVDQPDTSQSDNELLEQAKDFASQQQWQEAIDVLKDISPDSAVGKQVPNYLNSWSNRLIDDATLAYERGNLDEALRKAQGIPETSKYFDPAKSAIASWQQEKDVFDNIIAALEKWDVDTPRQEIRSLKNPILIQQVNARISDLEAKIEEADAKQKAAEAERQAAWQQYSTLSDQPLDVSTLDGKSALDLDILRNSLFAKHGLRFGKRSDLREAFEGQPWYAPNDQESEVIFNQFSELEKQNFQKICLFQKEKNLTLSRSLQCIGGNLE